MWNEDRRALETQRLQALFNRYAGAVARTVRITSGVANTFGTILYDGDVVVSEAFLEKLRAHPGAVDAFAAFVASTTRLSNYAEHEYPQLMGQNLLASILLGTVGLGSANMIVTALKSPSLDPQVAQAIPGAAERHKINRRELIDQAGVAGSVGGMALGPIAHLIEYFSDSPRLQSRYRDRVSNRLAADAFQLHSDQSAHAAFWHAAAEWSQEHLQGDERKDTVDMANSFTRIFIDPRAPQRLESLANGAQMYF